MIIRKTNNLSNEIKHLLTVLPLYRKNTNLLIRHIWTNEAFHIKGKNEFIDALLNGRLSSADSIRRIKAMIQNQYPELNTYERANKFNGHDQ